MLAIELLVLAFASQAFAHGMMTWPIMRIQPGDQQNGLTYAKSASNRNFNSHPDPDINCSYLPKGPVFTQTMAPGAATVEHAITAFHNGGCYIYLSRDNQQTWEIIGQDPTCGIKDQNPTGRGSIPVTIPSGTYSAVLRWNWVANNGGDPNEIFNSCADIRVSPLGTNAHVKVEMNEGPLQPGYVLLPKGTGGPYFAGCSQEGATACAGSGFINQCVSLAAGGGYAGGINWYQFQCPFGETCQAVNGVDGCVGSGGSVGPSSPAPVPQPDVTESSATVVVPPVVTAPVAPTASATSTPDSSCAVNQALVLPIPSGLTCVDVKHACQTFCLESQLYTIDRNQCFNESPGSAAQWCQCNGVTYYGAAFGTPTTACPTSTSGGSGTTAIPPVPTLVASQESTIIITSPSAPLSTTPEAVQSSTLDATTPAPTPAPIPQPDLPNPAVPAGSACSENHTYSCSTDGDIALCYLGTWNKLACYPGTSCGLLGSQYYCL
ncbi:hypothetical protein HDU98_009276 [Podochytrium sp. JEL0797]|nr:hypothetical protein HDU98_009276 [Podochytrium sp. JEL0797]